MQTLLDRDVDKLVFDPPEPSCGLFLPGHPGGSNKIYDRSPYGNNGTITGATWKVLPSGLWYLDFDGTDDAVSVSHHDSLSVSPNVTFEFWIYLNNLTGWKVILNKQYSTGDNWGYQVTVIGDAMYFFHGDGASWTNPSLAAFFPSSQTWYHVAITAPSPANAAAYRNGVNIGALTYLGSIEPNTAVLQIGRRHGGTPSWLPGRLALFRIYNKTLSALEIQNNFNREKHLFGVW